MPRLPSQKPPSADVPTLPIALLLGLICGGSFFGLLAMIFPGIGFLGIALLLAFAFFWLQYQIWARWIYSFAVRKEQEQEAKKRSSGE